MKRLFLILALLVASVGAHAQGTWSSVQSIPVSGMTNGKMFYQYLLVGDYASTGAKAPMLVYEHENSEGDKCYPNNPGACATLTAPLSSGGSGVQDWYNNAAFINRYCKTTGGVPSAGCVIVSVAADQTSDPSGSTSNFGGYADTDTNPDPNERGVIAVIQQLLSTLNADPNRAYVTGDSLGGIGSQAIGLDYGVNTGLLGHVITATMPFSGAIFRNGVTAPTNAQLARLQGGGFQFNINGTGDTGTSSNPALWTEPLWRAITGNSGYPGQPLGGRAGSSPIYVLVDTSLGHDVWDTYRPLPKGQPMLDLLFAQTGNGTPVTPPTGPTLSGPTMSVLPSGYLHTSGNQVQDGGANNVRLSCSNYANPTASPTADMSLIRTQGFNCVQVPWFDQVTCPSGTCNFTAFDAVVQAAIASNMRIVFVHQSNEGTNGSGTCTQQQANGLWYDQNGASPWTATNGTDGCGTAGTVSYAQFRANWLSFAQHYSGNQTVIGFDLHNEPTTFGNPACCATSGGGGGGGSGTGQFQVVGGGLIDPLGNAFIAHGINIDTDTEAGIALLTNTGTPLTTLFPHTNFLRMPVRVSSGVGTASAVYPDPASFATFIANATAAHIVVELEDHDCNGGDWEGFIPGGVPAGTFCQPPTGGTLTTMLNFWSSVAQMYKGNPYVWIGSLNEICTGDSSCSYNLSSIAAITTFENALYNAIRATGNNNIIQMGNGVGGGNPGTVGINSGQNQSLISAWHNVTWYLHSYYTDGSPSGALQQLQGSTAACCGGNGGSGYIGAQTLRSADGLVPVIFDECGSGTGSSSNGDASSIVSALGTIQPQGYGFACWAWFPSAQWQMVNNGDTSGGPFSLTTWGGQIAALTAAQPANPTTPVNPTGPAPPAVASAVGFNTLTYGGSGLKLGKTPDPITSYPQFTNGANIVPYTFTGTAWQSIGAVQNSDGSITIDGSGEAFGNGITTAAAGNANQTSNPLSFTGQTFGGGGLFQAVVKTSAGGPWSFWANDIETMNGVSVNAGPHAWGSSGPGPACPAPGCYGNWVETDFAEFDDANSYGIAFHHWYGIVGSGANSGSIFNKVTPSPTPDYTQYNTYAALWVPATSTAQGHFTFYFHAGDCTNGCTGAYTNVGTLTWNQYNAALAPPPVPAQTTTGGGSTFSVIDVLHLAPIFGGPTGGGSTVTIKSLQVWQANGNSDLPVIVPQSSAVGANWGSGNGGDLKAMVQDVGAAVEAADPGALIFVEGIFNNGALFNGTARGSTALPITAGSIGDLSTVGAQPPTCCTGHVVYTIHDQPTDLSGVAPDAGTAATTMRNTAWGYLETGNMAPLWIGKMGASLDNTNGQLSDENAWATGLTQYVNGQLTGQGGPAFTGCQQPMGGNWFTFGYLPGQAINGTLNSDNSNKAGQQPFWNSLLYTQCSTQNPINPVNPGAGATAWNPSDASSGIVLSGTNLIATTSAAGSQSVRTTTSQSAGNVCFAAVANTISPNWDFGIANTTYVLTTGGGLGSDSNGIGFDPRSAGGLQGIFFNNAVLSSGTGTSPNGEEELICADLTNKLFWATNATMRGNGNPWNNSATANPATGTGGLSFAGLTCPCFITWNEDEAGQATLNATGPFAIAIPTGFSAWQQPVTSGGHPTILIFGSNENNREPVNDNRQIAFAQPMDLTR